MLSDVHRMKIFHYILFLQCTSWLIFRAVIARRNPFLISGRFHPLHNMFDNRTPKFLCPVGRRYDRRT
ncbi:hypothetical protein X975_27021, partial [Stegodyphus mimosarum]